MNPLSIRIQFLTLCGLAIFAPATAQAQLPLQSGDRVVMIGGTLIEREQVEGYWESQITAAAAFPVTFRNLGWSGDNVWCESRGMFDPPAEGYKRMQAQIAEINPTFVIIGYGNSEAFDGPDRIPAFQEQYRKLLTDLQAPGRRFALLAPIPMEAAAIPGRNREAAQQRAQEYNASVTAYTNAIHAVVENTGVPVIALGARLKSSSATPRPGKQLMTDNGITLNAFGYYRTGQALAAMLTNTEVTADAGIQPPKIGSVSDWNVSADTPKSEQIRSLIRHKNELVFHRWRPQNFTYLFGFRKHEQGNNAVEIPQFDPLVAEYEAKIQALKGEQ